MTAKRLSKLVEELENTYYEYSSSEAAVQQLFVIDAHNRWLERVK